jgi:Fe2+ or Zn2+ uptake regulation protein
MALTLFTTVIAPGSAHLTPRQKQILALVTVAGGALSTSDVRARVNQQRSTPLVAEQVYRVLRALQDRGLLERIHIHGTNKAHWQTPARRAVPEAS